MSRARLMPNVEYLSETELQTPGWHQFHTLQLGIVFARVPEHRWAQALAWNYDEYTPRQVDLLGAASRAAWRADGSLPDGLDRLRCAVVHLVDVEGDEARELTQAAFAAMQSVLDAEQDGPAEPVGEHWLTVGELREAWMGRHRRRHFSDMRYTIHSFEIDDLSCIAMCHHMDDESNEFDEWDLEHLDRCRLWVFDDPFARLRFHRANLPTQEGSVIYRNWEQFCADVLDVG